MVRGGRSHGRSHHSGHHHHHHYGGGGRGRGATNSGAILRAQVNAISNSVAPPTLLNGIYTLQGSQVNVITRLNQTEVIGAPMMPTMPMMPMGGMMPMGNQMSV